MSTAREPPVGPVVVPSASLETDLDFKRADHDLAVQADARERERWAFEQRQARSASRLSSLTFASTGLVGIAAAIVGVAQLILAIGDDSRKTAQLELSKNQLALIQQEGSLHTAEYDLKTSQAVADRSASWAKFVADHLAEVYSENAQTRCRMKVLLRIQAGEKAFGPLYSQLQVPGADCENAAAVQHESELLAQARQAKLDGAPDGYVRRDPAGALLSQECSVTTENRHGRSDIVVSRSCALQNVSPSARIYKVDYSCLEFRCGWSYNPDGGYGAKVEIAHDGRSFTWQRRWDGDPATERYRFYYELKPGT